MVRHLSLEMSFTRLDGEQLCAGGLGLLGGVGRGVGLWIRACACVMCVCVCRRSCQRPLNGGATRAAAAPATDGVESRAIAKHGQTGTRHGNREPADGTRADTVSDTETARRQRARDREKWGRGKVVSF